MWFGASCMCGWEASRTYPSSTDAVVALEVHVVREHGEIDDPRLLALAAHLSARWDDPNEGFLDAHELLAVIDAATRVTAGQGISA